MPKDKWPFMKFYPADWIQDTQTITFEATGVWINLLCQMWIAPKRGILDWTRRQFTTFLRLQNDLTGEEMIAELSRVGDVQLRDEDGNIARTWEDVNSIVIKSRRMIREEEAREAEKQKHKRYNDKRTTEKRPTNDPETTDRSQKSEVRSQKTDKNKRRLKSQPSEEGRLASQTLADLIFKNDPTWTSPTEATMMEWAREADRLHKIDRHPWDEILTLLRWTQEDRFWKSNILSIGKFRKQWNQLSAHKKRGETHGKPKNAVESLKQYAEEKGFFKQPGDDP